jgi:hypothetical protein
MASRRGLQRSHHHCGKPRPLCPRSRGFLKNLGVSLIPATAPDFFLEDTPTAVLVRQVLGAIAQFEKASLVAKLKAARDRTIAQGIKCGGRKSYAERSPDLVAGGKGATGRAYSQ